VIKKRVNDYVFKLRDGTTTNNLNGTFRTLMRDSGLNREGDKNKTLYSLRHTYATLAILEENMDVYKLSKQMGTSVAMIERYYGHIKPSNIASQLAGRRMGRHKT
jgi:integrase